MQTLFQRLPPLRYPYEYSHAYYCYCTTIAVVVVVVAAGTSRRYRSRTVVVVAGSLKVFSLVMSMWGFPKIGDPNIVP